MWCISKSTNNTSTPSVQSDDTDSEDNQQIPTSLQDEELYLALNKEATEEELEIAITKCKELVLECDNLSKERKWLVRHLIELRLRLQEIREAKMDPQHPLNLSHGISRRSIKGHHFQLQPLVNSSLSHNCDHCTGTIWNYIQAWYQCEDCGFNAHHKCLALIIRECAHVTASEQGSFILDICPEVGLLAQKYKCAECKANLPVGNAWIDSQTRRCDYTGYYYCSACHWGGTAVSPARVIHNWDFSQRSVCQATLQLLRVTVNRPIINLEKLNPKLFALVHELDLVKRTRIELNQMRKYLLVCRNAENERLLWKHVDKPHLIESVDLYSLFDLYDASNGELPSKLLNLASVFVKHIKETCQTCIGRGHICEICSNDEVLYPFDSNAFACDKCMTVLHKVCVSRKNMECPKCIRLNKRVEASAHSNFDDGDDCD